MIEEFIDRAEGLCVKSDTKEELYKYFNNKTPLVIESESVPINAGEKTTLGDFFNEPLEYLGKAEDHTSGFYLGNDRKKDLFKDETKHYAECILVLNPQRIFAMTRPGQGRDFNWKNNKWK